MEENVDIEQQSENETPRPTFLKVLCILSYIRIGFSLLFGFIGLLGGPMTEDQMIEAKVNSFKAVDEMRSINMQWFADFLEKVQRMTESLNANFYGVTAISLSVLVLGLFGVFRMWNGFRLGFHLYIAYSILSVIQLYFFVAPNDVPTLAVVLDLLISGIFIFMYSRNLKWMNK